MATSDFSTLPPADDFADQLEDFRTALQSAIVQAVHELGEEADASEFDLRFLPLTLNDADLELLSLRLNDDETDPLTLRFSDNTDIELDELSTDDLVNLYQVMRDLPDDDEEDETEEEDDEDDL
ncbi:hypothetical protein ACO2Q8_13485 [Larkinella sp. VNQ87]|uniref:hypothetical protein n=1 Tax=Larkinella sp. VNQ87 TaxID=3400921 RepID=UPI003C0E947B